MSTRRVWPGMSCVLLTAIAALAGSSLEGQDAPPPPCCDTSTGGGEGPFGDPSCADGLDNDGDGQIDGLDPSCRPPLCPTTTADAVVVESMTDLGTLGGTFSDATGINDAGQVAGISRTASGEERAFLWQPDTGMIDLGVLPDLTPPKPTKSSAAHGINAAGQVVGESGCGLNCVHAFRWEEGTGMVDLGGLGSLDNEALEINDHGDVVGIRTFGSSRGSPNHAFLLPAGGTFTDLGSLATGPLGSLASSVALDINESRQVVGGSQTAFDFGRRAFLWEAETGMIDLGTLPGGAQSEAFGINEAGQVTGFSQAAGSSTRFAVRWQAETGISVLGFGPFSEARGINDVGQAVGFGLGNDASWLHGFVYQPGKCIVDLGVREGGSSRALRINNQGQVAGIARMANGENHAVLWTLRSGPIANRPPVAVCGTPVESVTSDNRDAEARLVRIPGFITGFEGLPVTFRAFGSWDPDGDPLSYDWDFGDGGTGTGPDPGHRYLDNGRFSPLLTVTDGQGLTGTTHCVADIRNVPPSVIYLGGTLLAGETFTTSVLVFDLGADTWVAAVDYGDGTGNQDLGPVGTTFQLSHTYAIPGGYDLVVTVTDDDGGVGSGRGNGATVLVRSSLQEVIQDIASMIEGLVAEGELAPDLAHSLEVKLEAATQHLDNDQPRPAAGVLGAFILELRALENAALLPPFAGPSLIADAERIVAVLDRQ